jgi:hypothetical protein
MGILACGLSSSMEMLIISRFVGFFQRMFFFFARSADIRFPLRYLEWVAVGFLRPPRK